MRFVNTQCLMIPKMDEKKKENKHIFLDQCNVSKGNTRKFTLGTIFFQITEWSSARLSQFWRAMNKHKWFPPGQLSFQADQRLVLFYTAQWKPKRKTSHQELNFPSYSIKALQRLREGNRTEKRREKNLRKDKSKCVHKRKVELGQYMNTEGSCSLTTLCLFEACSKLKRRIGQW